MSAMGSMAQRQLSHSLNGSRVSLRRWRVGGMNTCAHEAFVHDRHHGHVTLHARAAPHGRITTHPDHEEP